jgi:cysteine-rich repeat protein
MDGGPPPDAGPPKCGNNTIDPGEQCDDGNAINGDGCSSLCQTETCPNGLPDPGECGPEGTCPEDCMKCGNGTVDPNECGPMGACPEDCCLPQNTQIYAGNIPSSGPVWTYQGLTGLDAGNAACQSIGADHACTYAEIREAEIQGELTGLASGLTAWLHRTTDVPGAAMPGAGCRCNEWKYATNHISDGEFLTMQAGGVVSYTFDPGSCLFDANNPGMYTTAGLDCGGATRAIFCCFAECVKPPMP